MLRPDLALVSSPFPKPVLQGVQARLLAPHTCLPFPGTGSVLPPRRGNPLRLQPHKVWVKSPAPRPGSDTSGQAPKRLRPAGGAEISSSWRPTCTPFRPLPIPSSSGEGSWVPGKRPCQGPGWRPGPALRPGPLQSPGAPAATALLWVGRRQRRARQGRRRRLLWGEAASSAPRGEERNDNVRPGSRGWGDVGQGRSRGNGSGTYRENRRSSPRPALGSRNPRGHSHG